MRKQQCITEKAKSLIRYKAISLIGKYGFTRDDAPDIEQELYLDLLERFPNFDPEKSSYGTFVYNLVNNKVATLIQYRTQQKRDYRKCNVSLEDDAGEINGETLEVSDTIDSDECDIRLGRKHLPTTDKTDLVIDLAQAIESLPDDLKHIAHLLGEKSINEIADSLSITRFSVSRRIKKIRQHLEQKGISENFLNFFRTF